MKKILCTMIMIFGMTALVEANVTVNQGTGIYTVDKYGTYRPKPKPPKPPINKKDSPSKPKRK